MLPVVTITAAICYHVSNPSTEYSRATWTVRDWAPLSATFAGCRGRRLLTPLSAETTLPHRRWRRRRVDTRLPPIIIGLVCFANAPTLDKLLPCFVDVFTISYCDQSNLVDSVALCGEMNPITHLCSTTQSVNKWMYNYEQTICVELPTSADCVTPLAFAAECRAAAAPSGRRYRSISPAHRAHSSKPAAAVCSGRWMGKTDGQTNRQKDGHHNVRPCRVLYEQCQKLTDLRFLLVRTTYM